jgi:hypothetical protein
MQDQEADRLEGADAEEPANDLETTLVRYADEAMPTTTSRSPCDNGSSERTFRLG